MGAKKPRVVGRGFDRWWKVCSAPAINLAANAKLVNLSGNAGIDQLIEKIDDRIVAVESAVKIKHA